MFWKTSASAWDDYDDYLLGTDLRKTPDSPSGTMLAGQDLGTKTTLGTSKTTLPDLGTAKTTNPPNVGTTKSNYGTVLTNLGHGIASQEKDNANYVVSLGNANYATHVSTLCSNANYGTESGATTDSNRQQLTVSNCLLKYLTDK